MRLAVYGTFSAAGYERESAAMPSGRYPGTSPWNYGRTAAKQRKQRKGIMLMASNEVCTAGSVKRKGSAPAHLDEVAALRSTHLAVGLRDAAVMAHPQAQRAGVVSGTSPRTTWTPMAPCLVVAEVIQAALGGS